MKKENKNKLIKNFKFFKIYFLCMAIIMFMCAIIFFRNNFEIFSFLLTFSIIALCQYYNNRDFQNILEVI